ncbi:MAG TPA: CHAT domain-containing tetratricopeptide repeat protein, partial [Pyrinomonadaceae bacterium]|nr:CHAT domain-containing tetratricopeptide repeat protein [Pyrinomonadaceae bacterium]
VALGNTLNNIGMTYGWMGYRAKSLEYFERVMKIMHDAGDRLKESTVMSNICAINTALSLYKEAFEDCEQALKIKREIGDKTGEATALNATGNIYAALGEYQKALDHYQQAFEIHKARGEQDGEGITLNNIGWVYDMIGDGDKAIQIYTEALPPFRKLRYRQGIATVLGNVGSIYAERKEYSKALDAYLEALSVRSESYETEGRAITLSNMASVYGKLGEKQKALDHFAEAIALHRSIHSRRKLADTLRSAGVFHLEAGETSKALEYLNEARTIAHAIGDRNSEAAVLSNLARLERDRGNLLEAHNLIEEALAAIESIRVDLKSHNLRTSFLATTRKYYEFDIDVLMRLHKERPAEGFAAAALRVSEKSRARSLLELLREARTELRHGVDPSLIERENHLRRTIADRAEQQTRLLSGEHTQEDAAAAAHEMEMLTSEYDQVQTRIRQTSPRYAAVIEPQPISVEAIQKQVVDENTLLLEYSLGEEKSFVWAVTPDSVKSFELPGRAAIEKPARRFHQLLTERGASVAGETIAQRTQRLDKADAEYPQVAGELSQMLLGPVAAELKQKRLAIVAEGVLQYVPFAALPSPALKVFQPLIVEHEIVTLPSASVLTVLREEFGNRKPASKAVAVLADPVFSATDPRLKGGEVEESSLQDVQRSAAGSGLGNLMRLRFSRQEADEIVRLAGDGLKALDFSANRTMATDARLGDYRIIHFATHGLINNQHPDLSGIVLSLVDQQGRPQNGFLRLYDVYNLKLNADLVVLSACETALGKEIKGEGLVGLTRGFMYAGAPRVVASFWRIDDRATADVMRRFYSAMLKDGLAPSAALRAAQISMLRERRWNAPHYWAAFTLQGDWLQD